MEVVVALGVVLSIGVGLVELLLYHAPRVGKRPDNVTRVVPATPTVTVLTDDGRRVSGSPSGVVAELARMGFADAPYFATDAAARRCLARWEADGRLMTRIDWA